MTLCAVCWQQPATRKCSFLKPCGDVMDVSICHDDMCCFRFFVKEYAEFGMVDLMPMPKVSQTDNPIPPVEVPDEQSE